MISLGARFADYGLTGGLFLLVSLALFGWLFPAEAGALLSSLVIAVGQSTADLPAIIETFVAGVFAAAFIVVIFLIGLLLDLLSSLAMWEAKIFRDQLSRGEKWIRPVLNMYNEFISNDFDRFLEEEFVGGKNIFRGPRIIELHFRLQSTILSHILLRVDPAKLEILSDQFRLCRLARAISSGLFVLLMITTVIVLFSSLLGIELAFITGITFLD